MVPIVTTLEGIETDVNPLCWKALLPNYSNDNNI